MILFNMNSGETQWLYAVPGKMMNADEVHVWRAFLDVTTVEFEMLLSFLSDDEAARAGRFHFEKDRKRFIAARGILRKILGSYLNMPPGKICFEHSAHGKPMLAPGHSNDRICFNLSHSGSLALYAVTRNKNIGIDIESIRNDVSPEQVAQQFFSQNEISSLEKVDISKRSELFFQYWTRKEALVKAMGEGVSFPLEQIDVSKVDGKALSPIRLLNTGTDVSDWHIQDLFPAEGYTAAFAVKESDLAISYWDYR